MWKKAVTKNQANLLIKLADFVAECEQLYDIKIVYGNVEKSIDTWNKIPLEKSLELNKIYIGKDGEIYVLEEEQKIVKDIKNGKEYKYEGDFLQMYSNGFATIINGNKLHRVYFDSYKNS